MELRIKLPALTRNQNFDAGSGLNGLKFSARGVRGAQKAGFVALWMNG